MCCLEEVYIYIYIYIYVYNCDVVIVINVYLDYSKLCVGCTCIYGRRYVCYGDCNVVSNECVEPAPCLVQPIAAHGGGVIYFWSFDLGVSFIFLIVMIYAD